MKDSHIFLGLNSSVVCIEAKSGEIIWKKVVGSGFGEGFVSLALAETSVFAHTRGKIYCLDRVTGSLLWMNPLEGLGFGTAFICCDSTPTHYGDSALKKEDARSAGS